MKKCENCRVDVPVESYGIHLVRCKMYTFFCETCTQLVSTSVKDVHQMIHITERQNVQCKDCGFICKSQDLENHIAIDCPNRTLICQECGVHYLGSIDHHCLIACQFCCENVVLETLPEHILTCYDASKTVECEKCLRRIEARKLDQHMQDH